MQSTPSGLLLLFVAGALNASFAVPMKFTRGWQWENTWLVWSVFALLCLPLLLGLSLVPGFLELIHESAPTALLVAACGAAWGVAQVLFGLALEKIGIALTFSVVLGLSAAMGSLIPLVRLHAGQVFTRAGMTSMGGIVLVLAGVTACAVAGRIRERGRTTSEPSTALGAGLAMALVSGVCASMMNVGFAYGTPLSDAAAARGTGTLWLSNAIWAPLLFGAALPNVSYCVFLLRRNRTGKSFGAHLGRNTVLALLMAVLWFGSSILYGVSTVYLGSLGKVVGWPLFMSLIVILAGVLGFATGEWKNSAPRALRIQGLATLILICAVILLSRATM